MSMRLWFQRRRAFRGVAPLQADTPEGARVFVMGIARNLDTEDPFVAPVLGMTAVVAWMKYEIPQPRPNPTNQPPTRFERWHLRPFGVETPQGDVIVDASHVRLIVPTYSEGGVEELAVADGHPIAVIGSVLRDGIEIGGGEQSFRDAKVACKLVGNKRHPVVIARTWS
jgi:hypothetical protein